MTELDAIVKMVESYDCMYAFECIGCPFSQDEGCVFVNENLPPADIASRAKSVIIRAVNEYNEGLKREFGRNE